MSVLPTLQWAVLDIKSVLPDIISWKPTTASLWTSLMVNLETLFKMFTILSPFKQKDVATSMQLIVIISSWKLTKETNLIHTDYYVFFRLQWRRKTKTDICWCSAKSCTEGAKKELAQLCLPSAAPLCFPLTSKAQCCDTGQFCYVSLACFLWLKIFTC